MRLLAIDPASGKLGLAYFTEGMLIHTLTIQSIKSDSPVSKRVYMKNALIDILSLGFDKVVSEEPFLQGFNANGMQRLLGMIEALSPDVTFIHPSTVKKYMGHGGKDKIEVALAAGEMLETPGEKEIIADAIAREAWDETDAVAIGLTYLIKQKELHVNS